MKPSILTLALSSALLTPVLALAEAAAPAAPPPFTGNVTLASEYLYRGIAQSNGKPALQGGFDYAHPSGLYVGTWGSTISWLGDQSAAFPGGSGISAPIEIDVYGGYKNSFGGDWSYDIGVLTYNYPGSYPAGFTKADTTEVYGQLGWKWLSAKYSYVVSSHIFGFVTPTGGKTDGSGYLDLTANYDLGNGWGVTAHGGHQSIKGFSQASYTDWKLGVTKDVGYGTVGAYYSDTDAKGGIGEPYRNLYNRDLGKGRIVVSFTKTL